MQKLSWLFSPVYRLWIGAIFSALLPYVILFFIIQNYQGYAYTISMLSVIIAYYFSIKSIGTLISYPAGKKFSLMIFPNILFCFILVWIALRVLNLPYSLWYLSLGFVISLICCYINFYWQVSNRSRWAYIPLGRGISAYTLPDVDWIRCDSPAVPEIAVDGYIVDLYSPELTVEWQKFLAKQTLKGIPVYHIRHVEEKLTGRVKVHHMYENELGSLLPSETYIQIKYVLECVLIILSLPITLLVGLIVAILIKLEDGGSVIYSQPRVGYRGKVITVYKLRSMKENTGESVTLSNDDRITRVGKFIRKTRIDELPQFWNVLKGEMSLIGPRAEFKDFADELEQKVPFFEYRHIVKPGISGWAQVMHGYATGAEETQVKIEYDFYYIKHFSFSLDVLIFFKTIKTIFTGFGAR